MLGWGSRGRPQRVRGEGAGSDKSNSARTITIYLVYSDQESFKYTLTSVFKENQTQDETFSIVFCKSSTRVSEL